MKKIVSILLALTLMFSIVPMSVMADDTDAFDMVVYTDTEAANLAPGEEFTYTVSFSGTYDGYAIAIPKAGDCFTVVGVTANDGGGVDEKNDEFEISVIGGKERNNSDKISIATVSAKVNLDASAGAKELSIANPFLTSEIGEPVENIGYQYSSVVVVLTVSGDNEIAIEKPVKRNAPQTAVSGTGYTGTIEWSPAATEFAAETVYTANVTLTANSAEGYTFDSTFNPVVSDADSVTNVVVNDTEVTFKAKFPATNGKVNPVCVAPTGLEATYGDKLETVALENLDTNTAGTWAWKNAEELVGDVSDANTFTAVFTPDDTANYMTVEVEVSVKVNPKSIDISAILTDDAEIVYDGTEKTPAVTVTGDGKTLEADVDYTVAYDNNLYAGEGVAVVSAVNGGNYAFNEYTVNFTIEKAPINPTVAIEGWTYGNTQNAPAVEGNLGNGDVTYTYKAKDADDADYADVVPTDAGEYTVKATVAESDNYFGNFATADFVIAKADFTPEFTVATFVYGEGDVNPDVTSNASGVEPTYTYKAKDADDADYSDVAPVDAGVYTAKADFAESANYNAATATADFEITKKTIDNSMVADGDLAYGAVPVVTHGTKILVEDVDFEIAKNGEEVAGGSIEVVVTGIGNYEGTVTKSYAVATAVQNPEFDTPYTIVAGGTVDLDLLVDGVKENAAVTFAINGDANGATLDGSSLTVADAGTSVVISVAIEAVDTDENGTPEYSAYSNDSAITVLVKLPQETLTVSGSKSVKVGNTSTYTYAGGSGDGAVTYSVAEDTGEATIDENGVLTAVKAGKVIVIVTKAEDDNYCEAAATFEVTISKASSTVIVGGGSSSSKKDDDEKEEEKSDDTKEEEKTDDTKEEDTKDDESKEEEKSEPAVSVDSFSDVKGHWAYDYIKTAVEKKLMNGVSEKDFAPEMTMNRAMFVTILYRVEEQSEVTGSSSFVDVEKDSWYEKAVIWASENKIVNGVSESEFAPYANVTREQMVTMLYRYAQAKGLAAEKIEGKLDAFADKDSVSDYAVDAKNWAVAVELINGIDGKIVPQGEATRAQAAAVFVRFLENIAK